MSRHRSFAAAFGLAALLARPALAQDGSPAPSSPPPHAPDPDAARTGFVAASVTSRTEPEYPPSRLEAEHGPGDRLEDVDLELELTIDATGALVDVKAIASAGADFDQQAMAAVKTWTFSPATQDGKAVSSKLHVPFHFEPPPHAEPVDVTVTTRRPAASRGGGDYRIAVGELAAVPRTSAAKLLEMAPGVFLTKDGGGEGHADGIFMRGFDAGDGEGIEMSVGGIPINEPGNFHANGTADLNFLIPELVTNLRVLEGPFDPRQGNFAVAGSADYELGLARRGLTAKVTYGAFDTARLLLTWGPEGESPGTFAGAEVYRTSGFGQNRDAVRARALGQYEGRLSPSASFRVTTAGYFTQYHAAGVVRADDVASGRIGFYDTYDTRQGGGAARALTSIDIQTKSDDTTFGVQAFGAYTSTRVRENGTGFIADEPLPQETPHEQRGDLIDLVDTAGTVGLRGFGRQGFELFGHPQDAELGVFARGDLVGATQQRVASATDAPYKTEADVSSRLGDIGLYGDVSLRLLDWLAVRGGARLELLAYDVDDLCAVTSSTAITSDESCLSVEADGRHREPNQRASVATLRPLPRASVLFGPFTGFTLSASYGQGVRSIDPSSIRDNAQAPYAAVDAFEAGAGYAHSFEALTLTAQSMLFATHLDKDQIADELEGRQVLSSATTRAGWAGSVRLVGDFFDSSTSLTFVKGRFDDGSILPYVPQVVFREEGALFHELFELDGSEVTGRLGLGVGVVGPRELPSGAESDPIVNLDAGTSLGWRFLELEVQGTNLLDLENHQAELEYASDFDRSTATNLTPARHFAAGAPLGVFVSLSGTLGASGG